MVVVLVRVASASPTTEVSSGVSVPVYADGLSTGFTLRAHERFEGELSQWFLGAQWTQQDRRGFDSFQRIVPVFGIRLHAPPGDVPWSFQLAGGPDVVFGRSEMDWSSHIGLNIQGALGLDAKLAFARIGIAVGLQQTLHFDNSGGGDGPPPLGDKSTVIDLLLTVSAPE